MDRKCTEKYRDASQFKIANALIQDNTSEERDSLRAGSLVGRVSLAKELARGMGRGLILLAGSRFFVPYPNK